MEVVVLGKAHEQLAAAQNALIEARSALSQARSACSQARAAWMLEEDENKKKRLLVEYEAAEEMCQDAERAYQDAKEVYQDAGRRFDAAHEVQKGRQSGHKHHVSTSTEAASCKLA